MLRIEEPVTRYFAPLFLLAMACSQSTPPTTSAGSEGEGLGGASGHIPDGERAQSDDAGAAYDEDVDEDEDRRPRDQPARSQAASQAEPDPEADGVGDIVLNEVACRGGEYVEIVNRGTTRVSLAAYAIGDGDDRSGATALDGVLDAGERATFSIAGLACDQDHAVLFHGQRMVHRVRAPLGPADASFARLPDTTGEFGAAALTPDAANRAYVDDAARLFLGLDQPVPRRLPRIDVDLDADAEASLRMAPREYVPATLQFEDDSGTVGPISTGIRIKGLSVERTLDEKAAFRLDLDRFEAGGHLFGIEKLTLNNFVQDPSASHERLFYGILQRRELAAPRVGYVEVFVNGEYFGVYLALESSDEGAFLGRSFASTALLYEGQYGQDLYPGRAETFDQDYGDDPSRQELTRIIDDVAAASDAAFVADTRDTIDWDNVISQMAADVFCGHFDSYTANRNNFTLHIDDDSRLGLISGGADQSFTEAVDVTDIAGGQGGMLLSRCTMDSECAQLLDAALADTAADVDRWLSAGGEQRLRADAATLRAHFAGDPRREWDEGQLERLVDELIEFVEGRSAVIAR
jgi:hypothetical protein